jgi:YVTN family beta-propeller protein
MHGAPRHPAASIAFVLFLMAANCPLLSAETNPPVAATLPNGRKITPQGGWLTLAPYPFALAARPDGQQIVIPSIGWPFSLNVVDHPDSSAASVMRIAAKKSKADSTAQANSPVAKPQPEVEVHAGVAYSLDGRLLYDATGDSGAVDVLSTETWKPVARISLNGPLAGATYSASFSATLTLSRDGRVLYVLDQANWRVVAIDLATNRAIASFATGVSPFGLALSPDGRRLYITNSGLFEYKLIGGVKKDDVAHTGLHFPPFGYPSKAARSGAVVEGRAAPGLGNENDVRGSSLWTYDVRDPGKPSLIAKLRLGELIRSGPHGTIGGGSPSGVLAGQEQVYVTLAHDDAVVVVTPDGKEIKAKIPLTPFAGAAFQDAKGRPLRGVMPIGLAQDATRLFVTEAGINAVAVIDKASGKVLGHIPVGWFPAAVALSADGARLYVVNAKGKGAGPNGGSTEPADAPGDYIGELEFGSLSVVRAPRPDADLVRETGAVVENNQAALASRSAMPRLQHVFYIIRENRTFDEILGDLPGVNGDSKLARFGMHGWAEENANVKDVRVTPNAHSLAARFGTSDAFFADGDVSVDGHRWAMGMSPSPWLVLAWTSSYGGRRTRDAFSESPGRRAMGGGSDAPMPEDEPEFGSLWEHIAGSGVSLRNYGEGLELEGSDEDAGMEPEGQRLVLNSPVPQPVFVSTDKAFPTFNLGIPDQLRVAEFSKDFSKLLAKGKAPALTVIRLPNDHTTDPRPADGYPFRASYVADNDLALGKIVEYISRSAIWPSSAIFVIEDDAQSGRDHVDAHRSVLLAIGPHIKKGFVSHRHASFPSVQKTIYELLGLGPLNLEDALAADLSDMFTASPDLAPFTAEASDPRVFKPSEARIAHPKTAAEARKLLDADNPREIAKEFHKKQEKKTGE